MYIPYRKAYLSGMNPLSFVTVFTVGELATTGALAVVFLGGVRSVLGTVAAVRPVLFWLFLGGFWAICFNNMPPNILALAGAFHFPTPTSFGAWRGAHWCLVNFPASESPLRPRSSWAP